jgi:membrane-associated phospholipid phosphatase
LVDYGLIAAGTTALIVGEEVEPTYDAGIGPAYNPDDPGSFFASPDAQLVGERFIDEHQGETVPASWVMGAIGGATLYLGALEGKAWADGSGSAQQFHDMMIGFLETTALTAGVTNLVKPSVGRLRPDFQDRALRHVCSTDAPSNVDCDGYRNQPLSDDPDEAEAILLDGRRSFFSGHSSNAFSVFTYTSLAIGGHYVWGDDATPRSRAAGIFTQSLLMTTASYVAGSRLIDGRHHVSDVLSGAAVGLAFANFSYWRRFDLAGNPRGRDLQFWEQVDLDIELGPAPNGAGVQLTVRH